MRREVLIGCVIGLIASLGHMQSARHEVAHARETVWQEATAYQYEDVPGRVQDAAIRYGEEYGICPELLIAIARQESEYRSEAVRGDCIGLMQVSTRWHADRMRRLGVDREDMWTADGSMHVAADYLAELFEEYEDAATVLMVYNGDSRVRAYIRGESPMSTYAHEILEYSQELERRKEHADCSDI